MKINQSTVLVLAAALLIADTAYGQASVPNVFQPGRPARASEVNANFTALEVAVNQNADDLSQVPILAWMGDWQSGVVYAVDNLVQFQGSTYIAIQETTGAEDPADIAFWSLFASEGVVGPMGPQGIQGIVGPVGPQGPQGDTGIQGPIGPQGPVGPVGPIGPDGPVGPEGPVGPLGPEGPQGPPGQDAVIDPTVVQLRVSSGCVIGSYITSIAEDGSVTCETGSFGNRNHLSGTDALASNTTGFFNTAIGVEALFANTTGGTNTAIGVRALTTNTDGFDNTAVGVSSLFSNTSGWGNTAIGMSVLTDNTTGTNNTANGILAMTSNRTGNRNTASGAGALFTNRTGDDNTAIGDTALYSNVTGMSNTAAGAGALWFNNASDNTAVGYNALNQNTLGASNTALGYSALWGNTLGMNNIAIGAFAGNDLTDGNSNIMIGNRGFASEANTIRIGDALDHTRAYIAGIQGVTTGINDAVTVVVDSSGQLGTISSSRRYKEDIADMGAASERLLALRPVTFRYKQAYGNGEQPLDYGLLAEQVAEVFPELVVFNENNQPETVKYRLLSSLLLNELQKQHSELSGQAAQIEELKETLDELTRRINQLGHIE